MDDVGRLRQALQPLEADARHQRWDRERPWRVATHVRREGELVVVDLHDLKVGLARRAVHAAFDSALQEGAVVFVTGRGRHSMGPGSPLRQAVVGTLQKACGATEGWAYRLLSPGRVAWIHDHQRAPASLGGGGSGWLWLWLALLALAFVVGLWGKLR